jgi:hypothetical protein
MADGFVDQEFFPARDGLVGGAGDAIQAARLDALVFFSVSSIDSFTLSPARVAI